jgi:hypothetical protein
MQKPGCYLILGYPFLFSNEDIQNNTIYSEPLRYVTELCDDDPSRPVNQDLEVFLKYPESNVDSLGYDVTVPNPKGISGCGIWRLAEIKPSDKWRRDDCKLVGIEYMWSEDKRFIKGTRVKHVLQLIYRRYPPLRPIMDLHLGLITAGW